MVFDKILSIRTKLFHLKQNFFDKILSIGTKHFHLKQNAKQTS